jgi:hypothetical protein
VEKEEKEEAMTSDAVTLLLEERRETEISDAVLLPLLL